jgi:hypothetical protein
MLIPLGILAASGSAPTGDYELISTTVLGSTQASVVLSSIPQNYKHLQLRITARASRTFSGNSNDVYQLTLNSSTPTTGHALYGQGSSVSSFVTSFLGFPPSVSSSPETNSSIFGGAIFDIVDYTNTSKNRVVRSLSGHHMTNTGNGDVGNIGLFSNLYLSTEATNSVTITTTVSTYLAGSRFSIYGIRG